MGVPPLIVHLDADAFFVACEQARRPELRGTKCAVGGTERGIISSASYEARACGVYTPMPTSRARQVCPDLILIPHTSGLYGEVSRRMFDLCETLTPVVQRNSIDEGYLDLGPCGLTTTVAVEAAVRKLQKRIWDELQITVSMGIAANKLVAQIASKLRKPRGFVVVARGDEAEFLAPLALGKLPGIGAKTEAGLVERGFGLIGDLLGRSEAELKAAFGDGWREMVAMARGIDERPVETESEDAKSYSQQETFGEDVGEFAVIERVAKRMIDELLPKVRADGKRVRTITVKVRYGDFTQTTHGKSLADATDLEAPFYPLVGPLLREAWTERRKLRLVSVRFSGVEEGAGQMEMFAQSDEKRRRLAEVLDKLNNRGGTAVVQHGHQIGAKQDQERGAGR
ncbi:MAG: DNA polymerase IV [Opitutia bacterium]|nr:DNA polymerase IV [Opitutaceae bacterium]PHX85088.1 MAG: DNA polymerase IV [Opitutae bacterium]